MIAPALTVANVPAAQYRASPIAVPLQLPTLGAHVILQVVAFTSVAGAATVPVRAALPVPASHHEQVPAADM